MRTFVYRTKSGENLDVAADSIRFDPGFVTFWDGEEMMVKTLVVALPSDSIVWVTELTGEKTMPTGKMP